MSASLYELLGVAPTATSAELRAAYRRRVLEVHPDKGGSVEVCRRVMGAFEQLADPERRRLYDKLLGPGANHSPEVTRTRPQEPPGPKGHVFTVPKRKRASTPPVNFSRNMDGSSLGSRTCSSATGRHAPHAPPGHRQQARGDDPSVKRAYHRRAASKGDSPANVAGMSTTQLQKVVQLLRCLGQEQRRHFLQQHLLQPQRLALEAFMRVHRTGCAGAGEMLRRLGRRGGGLKSRCPSARGAPCRGRSSRAGLPDSQGRARPCRTATKSRKLKSAGPGQVLGHPDVKVGRGAVATQGITRTSPGGYVYYRAQVCFAYFILTTRWRHSLDQAVDDHMTLLTVKSQTLSGGPIPLEERLKLSIAEVTKSLDEEQAEELGLGICVCVSACVACLLVGRHLNSPTYGLKELDLAIHTWRQFRAADERHYLGQHAVPTMLKSSPPESQEVVDTWKRVREAYLQCWKERGTNIDELADRLDGLAAQQADRRCRRWQHLENVWMAQEEQRALRATKAAERQRQVEEARRARAEEANARRREQEERMGMQQEDNLARTMVAVEKRALQSLLGLASKWRVQLEKRGKQGLGAKEKVHHVTRPGCRVGTVC